MHVLRVLAQWLHAGWSLDSQYGTLPDDCSCVEFTLSHLTLRLLQVSQLSFGLLRVIFFLTIDIWD
jgi:hypothetical protein